jgi:23S rRNA (cytosine1962-C5)-methyltransferase
MNVDTLLNRLDKNRRHLARWAQRENIEAYRLYDRDMPEFPLAIDLYGEALHVQVFERKRPLTDTQLAALREALLQHYGLQPLQLALKTRRRQRGLAQYEKLAAAAPSFRIGERGHRFEVNLHRYLDSGLFLDHRDTRQRVGENAAGRSFLNLFAYTGSFTVYAAAGGARSSVTVDMSRTYQAWSQRNLQHNGLAGDQHKFVQADVFAFLERMVESRARFDLIVLDPPSFSNSKRMQHSFDIQRDQLPLLGNTLKLLAPGGQLWFSNNRQGFKLDPQVADQAEIEEVTERTVPQDFARHRPHRCWVLRR